ncbi:LemA family protein [Thiopseudomonas alkaliphila]|uniref:LemA family protein n=1 Tax=Thiopseudomonas alkaliphila TaxID=1697053 RepID=UPI00069ED5F0|nr:LemA family protein [Thiopseudomonas alkaliphila]AKX53757.1 LemA family protein [Thiopseudomonas alkaliphila]
MKFLVMLIALAALVFYLYNRVVTLREAVISSETAISVQLDRRGKVFDSLLATVKKYLSHESEVFTKITELRAQAQSTNPSEAKAAEQELSKVVSSGAINVAVENYPELKSAEIMTNLQEEIVSTENKLSFAKTGYNNSLEKFRAYIASFPALFIMKFFPSLNLDKDYWRLDETAIKQEEERRISFD